MKRGIGWVLATGPRGIWTLGFAGFVVGMLVFTTMTPSKVNRIPPPPPAAWWVAAAALAGWGTILTLAIRGRARYPNLGGTIRMLTGVTVHAVVTVGCMWHLYLAPHSIPAWLKDGLSSCCLGGLVPLGNAIAVLLVLYWGIRSILAARSAWTILLCALALILEAALCLWGLSLLGGFTAGI